MRLEPDWQVYAFYHKRRGKTGKEERWTEAWLFHRPSQTKLVVTGPLAIAAAKSAKEWFEGIDHQPGSATHIAADYLARASRARFHKTYTYRA